MREQTGRAPSLSPEERIEEAVTRARRLMRELEDVAAEIRIAAEIVAHKAAPVVEDRLLTDKEAAAMLGMSVPAFREHYRQWGLEPFGWEVRALRFRLSDVQRYIREGADISGRPLRC